MANSAYMAGRKQWGRPQAILFSENSGTLSNGFYIPNGLEIGQVSTDGASEQFLILSDHNRGALDFSTERIEKRERTINGKMRSYHIADKLKLNTSWSNLPSRSYLNAPEFTTLGKPVDGTEYTVDGGAGGAELLDWYENHTGSFWVFLAYDKYTEFGKNTEARRHLQQYNQVIEMYISSFTHTVTKRGQNSHDFWNVNISLEEA
jgi:hypothetical protein